MLGMSNVDDDDFLFLFPCLGVWFFCPMHLGVSGKNFYVLMFHLYPDVVSSYYLHLTLLWLSFILHAHWLRQVYVPWLCWASGSNCLVLDQFTHDSSAHLHHQNLLYLDLVFHDACSFHQNLKATSCSQSPTATVMKCLLLLTTTPLLAPLPIHLAYTSSFLCILFCALLAFKQLDNLILMLHLNTFTASGQHRCVYYRYLMASSVWFEVS